MADERFIPCRFERLQSSGFLVFSSPAVMDTQERNVMHRFEGGQEMKLVQRDGLLMVLNSQPERAPELKWLWEPMEDLDQHDRVVPEHGKISILLD